jgi:predicted transcriptional regulator
MEVIMVVWVHCTPRPAVDAVERCASTVRMSRLKTLAITSPKAWVTMTAPVRLEMLEALRLLGPCAIADIASMLDRPADALYRHMDKLVRLGAVRELEQRKVGRRLERTYDVVADHIQPGFRDGGSKAANQAYDHTVKVICKIAGRASRDAAQSGQLKFSAEARTLAAMVHHGWLTPAEFARARGLIVELQALLGAGRRRPDARLYVIASMLLPVVRKRGARRARVGGVSAAESSASPGVKERAHNAPATRTPSGRRGRP